MKPVQWYERMIRQVQADARIPALSVAVHRVDRPLWTFQVGADVDATSQLRIGSVSVRRPPLPGGASKWGRGTA